MRKRCYRSKETGAPIRRLCHAASPWFGELFCWKKLLQRFYFLISLEIPSIRMSPNHIREFVISKYRCVFFQIRQTRGRDWNRRKLVHYHGTNNSPRQGGPGLRDSRACCSQSNLATKYYMCSICPNTTRRDITSN